MGRRTPIVTSLYAVFPFLQTCRAGGDDDCAIVVEVARGTVRRAVVCRRPGARRGGERLAPARPFELPDAEVPRRAQASTICRRAYLRLAEAVGSTCGGGATAAAGEECGRAGSCGAGLLDERERHVDHPVEVGGCDPARLGCGCPVIPFARFTQAAAALVEDVRVRSPRRRERSSAASGSARSARRRQEPPASSSRLSR